MAVFISPERRQIISTIARQGARWTIASRQDKNPVVRYLHSVYGAGFQIALRSIADDEEVRVVTGTSGRVLEAQAVEAMDSAVAQIGRVCPNIVPRNGLVRLARQGLAGLPDRVQLLGSRQAKAALTKRMKQSQRCRVLVTKFGR